MSRRFALLFAVGLLVTAAQVPVAAQLPAGTRDAQHGSSPTGETSAERAAEAALERGDFAAARVQLEALALRHPTDARVLYDLGFAAEHLDDAAAAFRAYSRAVAADPAAADPLLALGLLDAREGRISKARDEFASVAAMQGALPELRARALRAMARIDATDKPQEASASLLAAIKLSAETPDDTALSAALAARAGDTGDAEAAFRRALTADPGNVDAALGLARLLQKSGRSAEASGMMTPVLAAHPDDPSLLSAQASLLAAAGRNEDAIKVVQVLQAKAPQDARLARQLARLYLLNGQPERATPLYQLAAAGDPSDPSLLDDLGTSLVRQRRFAEAQQVLQKAVSMRDRFAATDDFGETAGHLAFAASRNKDPQTCLQALALRATVLPNSAPSLFLEATAHDTLHQYKEASKAYRAFLLEARGHYPDEEFEARHRLVAIEHSK